MLMCWGGEGFVTFGNQQSLPIQWKHANGDKHGEVDQDKSPVF